MPGNCDVIEGFYNDAVERLEEANAALGAAAENAAIALASMAAAETWAASCFWLALAPPALAACEIPALAAVAAAAYAVSVYEEQAAEAAQAVQEIQGSLDTLSEALGHCLALEELPFDPEPELFAELEAEAEGAYDRAMSADIPDVDSDDLDDAEEAVAEAEEAVAEADAIAAASGQDNGFDNA